MSAPPNSILRIGLTGGIASGKSTVADLFAARGITVIDTDEIAREVVAPGTAGLAMITAAFDPEILRPDGTLDRAALRKKVFADDRLREQLEAILHPLIRAATLEEAAKHADDNYQIFVVPLLVETGFRELVDRVLVVDCPTEMQRARLMARDAESNTSANDMIRAQISREERLAVADDVIHNDAESGALEPAVQALHQKYQALAAGNIV
jgi:dephospho-CoA kinase